jgi:hypothetical protein
MSVGYQNNRGGQKAELRGAQGADQADWGTLKEDVNDLAGVAVQRGRQFVDTARHQATDYVDRRKNDAAQSVADLAGALREAMRSFEDRPNIRAFADNAADGLDQLAGTIRQRSFAEIFDEMESVMRRRPLAAGAVTFAAGFVLARFIKSSAEGLRHEYQQRQRASGQQAAGGMRGPDRHS